MRYLAVGCIVFLIVSMIIIVSLEFYWHIEAKCGDVKKIVHVEEMLSKLETFEYLIEIVFFSLAVSTLILLYKRLTECFK